MVKKKTNSGKKHTHKNKSENHGHSHSSHVKKSKSGKNNSTHSSKKNKENILQNVAIIIGILAVVAILYWAVSKDLGNNINNKKGTVTNSGEILAATGFDIPKETLEAMKTLSDDDAFLGAVDAPVTIVEFSDFQCPYCGKFRSETFDLIKEKFVDAGIVKFVYRDLPLSFHPFSQKAAEASECAHEQGKFWEYHDLVFDNQNSLGVDAFKKFALDLNLNVEQFDSCLTSGKYTKEVQDDAKAASELGISGTPGFVVNGKVISGALPYEKFEQTICNIVPTSQPCKDIPPPVAVEVTIVNDKDCKTCDTTQIKTVTKEELFSGATFVEVDAKSDEGKALIKKYDLLVAPSYLFSESVAETKTWKTNTQLQGAFLKTDDGYMLRPEAVGASWYFDEEKQKEAEEAARIAAEEAAKAAKEGLGVVKNDNIPQVDFFVMSFCPYGNQAEELLKPVFDKLKGQANFVPRYVIYNQGDGCYTDTDGTSLCSLHGGVELNQDIRELCVYKNNGEQEWFDFALAMNEKCDYKNADTCWEQVAKDLGLSTTDIQTCFDENKISYAREQFELNKKLGVSGSPTLFFEGEKYSGQRSSNGYLSTVCSGFENAPAVCDELVNEPVPSSANSADPSCG